MCFSPLNNISGFIYRLFSTSLLTTSFTNSSYPSSPSILIITSSIKLATFSMLIKSHRILFIMVWNIAGEFVSLKNIMIGSNDLSGVVNTAFHSSPSFILMLLYFYHKSIFVNTFLVPMFSTIFEMRGNR